MGLFSSKTKTTVATTVTRAIEDKLLPNSPVTGTIRATHNGGDITEHMLEEMIGSIGIRADRMYEYGDTKYAHGLPSGEFHTGNQGEEAVKSVLQNLEGKTVVIDYSRYGPPNTLHIGWMKLISQYGYNPATNLIGSLTSEKEVNVYLKDMAVFLPQSWEAEVELAAFEQWGVSPKAGTMPPSLPIDPLALKGVIGHTPIQFDPNISKEEVRVTAIWEESVQVGTSNGLPTGTPIYEIQIFEEVFVIPIVGYANDKDYFHARYLVNGVIKYWIYEVGQGTYPVLDEYFGVPPAENGSFFPFVYFRFNKVADNEDKTSQAYKTSKKLVKYLGMDYDKVTEAINSNPDIEDVAQAMLIMAVPANTENAAEQRYLFDFFDAWYDSTEMFTSETQANLFSFFNNDPDNRKNTIVIQDKRFKMALGNNGIFKSFVAGNIGPVDSHAFAFETFTETVTFSDGNGEVTYTYEYPVRIHYYRRQVTEGLYVELKVVDLRMQYFVDESYAVTADEEDDILLIPLDRSLTEKYSLLDREELYSRSLHYVFNSLIITKIKWYQTGFFKAILIVVAIAVSLYFGVGGELISALVSGASAATISALATAFLVEIVTGLIMAQVFKYFVRAIGIRAAFVIAIVAAAVGAYQIIAAGSVKGAPFATELLSLSTGLAKAAVSNLQDMMQDVMKAFEDFNAFVKEQTKTLESAQDLLNNSVVLSPFIIFGERPEDFYNRTIHSGNIGTASIEAISQYVESSLKLPTLYETIEV